jgi:hypothetical protein
VHFVDAPTHQGVRVKPPRVIPVALEHGLVNPVRFRSRQHLGYRFNLVTFGLAQRPTPGNGHPRCITDPFDLP